MKKCKECGGALDTAAVFTGDASARQCVCGQKVEVTREDEEDALRSLDLPELEFPDRE